MSKTNIDELWASMNQEVAPVKLPNFEKLQKGKKATKKKLEMNDPLKILKSKRDKSEEIGLHEVKSLPSEPLEISLTELQSKLNKEINALGDGSHLIRKKGLQNLNNLLFVEYKLSGRDYSELFRDICRPLFKRFADSSEKCRELSQRLSKSLFENSLDVAPVLAYYFPALLQRIPSDLGYDEELKVFVIDKEAHNAYKRGKAIERQDKAGVLSEQSIIVVETSEEIRYLACDTLLSLLQRVRELGSYPILHPYFEEIVIFLQLQLRDPFPDLKMVSSQAFELLARVPDFELGMKYYSVAICRALLPVLRHRHAKVRCSAVAALHHVMIVPDRAKRKGSGTEAIQDLVGFREENILPIAAFYKDDVQVNYLAELVSDKSPQVREKLVEYLTSLLTTIDDRYDHQTRLLPYLLDLMTDEVEFIANNAYRCLQMCGKQYEEEHNDEILEKRQYGIDGDDRINLEKPFPKPFLERPRIGMRMYVRGNSKRFLMALVNELTNWIAPTRLKSGNLLKLVIVLCEEHTTMEMHAMLPQLMKALKFARDDKDSELQVVLHGVFELLGRYILPEIYLYYILPRLRGDSDVQPFGIDAETRVTAMEMLSALLEGSKANTIIPYFQELVQTLVDPFVISPESVKQQSAAMKVLSTVLSVLHGKSKHAIEAYYVATGRITSLQVTIRQIFRYLLLQMSTKDLSEQAWEVLVLLSQLETDPVALQHSPVASVGRLFYLHASAILSEEISRYEIDAAWTARLPEHQVISRLLEFPVFAIHQDTRSVRSFLSVVFEVLRSLRQLPMSATELSAQEKVRSSIVTSSLPVELENEVAQAFNRLLVLLLKPLVNAHSLTEQQCELFSDLKNISFDSISDTLKNAYISETMKARMCSATQMLLNEQETVLEELIQVMILTSRWNRSVSLNRDRMELLFLLLGQNDQDDDCDDETTTVILKQPLLIRHMPMIVANVATASLIPTTPEPNRIAFIRLMGVMLRKVQIWTGMKRVLSKEKVIEKLSQMESSDPQSVFTFSTRQQYFEVKGSAQVVLHYCLQALEDGSDEVRNLAMQTFLENIQFLFVGSEEIEEWKHLMSPTSSAVEVVENNLLFENVVISLFQRCVVELDKFSALSSPNDEQKSSQTYIDLLDTTLRLMCVIKPLKFEEVIRSEAIPIVSRSRDLISVRMSEFINGLINHVDIILSMR